MDYNFTEPERAYHRSLLIAALRSGQYRQNHGCLHVCRRGEMSWCALGVACEISKLGIWTHRSNEVKDGCMPYRYTIEGHMGAGISLPLPVCWFFGFRTCYGDYLKADGNKTNLVNLNDGLRWSFEDIADVIAAAPYGLFL